jgi:dTDP-4-dehydrorhamnose reductase
VLGGTGMLGSMLVDVLSRDTHLSVYATGRDKNLISAISDKLPGVVWCELDAWNATDPSLLSCFSGMSWIINAIGITTPFIAKEDAFEIERAIRINSLFPSLLNAAAKNVGARVLQIATDGVFSGKKGQYLETDLHDPTDVYGKSKSLGEVRDANFFNLRSSIIGPEAKSPKFLLEWFLGQAKNSQVNGFTNHDWNGVTTLQFSKIVHGLIKSNIGLPNICHVIGDDRVSKSTLLKLVAHSYDRRDIQINDAEAATEIDRTLACRDKDLNERIWAVAGYSTPPTIADMVQELSEFDYRAAR